VPVRARRAKARERLPSYREPASRNPQAEPARTVLIVSAFPRTVSPSLGPCSASGGASSFPPASALLSSARGSCDLPVGKARDASDQLLPPVRTACTRTSRVPGSLRGFHRVDLRGVLGSEQRTRGPGVSRHPRTLRRTAAGHALPLPLLRAFPSEERSMGVFYPWRPLQSSL
jgi:hypothetical protein